MATNYNNQRQSSSGGGGREAVAEVTISVADIKLANPIPENLFSDIAAEKAQRIHEAGGRDKNKSTQLRKFYDELVMWTDKVHREQTREARSGKYTELAPFIKMMNAKVAYARGRNHVDACFEQMFSHVVRQIADPDSLKHAKLFMEAFMGFYKAQEK